jgi:peptidoglycan/xylan/chitin deacetylase (PgdA/CDA1 family)
MGNYYEKILTKTFSPILDTIGTGYLTKPVYSGKGQILMFHRIIPAGIKKRIHNHLSLEVDPVQLEQVIAYFKKRKYRFISLDKLPDWLRENKKSGDRFVVFTFDDGYRDNRNYAYPILKKHGIPFVIYVTTSFPDDHAVVWWYMIEDLILNNDRINYSFESTRLNLECSTYRQKESAFTTLRNIITRMDEITLPRELPGFFSAYGMDVRAYGRDLALGWNEIKELSGDSLVNIGAHTVNHLNLSKLSDDQSYYEISESKKIIESKIDAEVRHFCYPLGKYGPREIDYARKCRFHTGVTTHTANIFPEHLEYLFTLPRISINSLTTEKVLNLQVNGFYPSVLNRFKRIIH